MSDKQTESSIVNKVIEELSRINDAAAGYAENAENAKIKLGKDYREAKENFDEKLNDEAKERLDALREKLTAENNAKIDNIHAEHEAYLERLDKAFAECHSVWAQEIAEEIEKEFL